MNLPQVVSREEWLAPRKELLAKEKEATRARDALNAERRGLPMVRVEKEYVFALRRRPSDEGQIPGVSRNPCQRCGIGTLILGWLSGHYSGPK